jgi:hypothetical protein
MIRLSVCCLVLLFQTLICEGQERLVPLPTPKRPATRPAKPAFIIGVFQQPTSSFDVWRSRGVNTLVGYEAESGSRRISNHDWTEAAAAKGFYCIRQPSDDLEADARDPNLLAWMQDDEPDVRKPPTDPNVLKEKYAAWKRAGPNVPVFVNFSGGNVLGGKIDRATYVEYMKAADWVGDDFYAVTGYNRPDWLWKVGAAVDRLREWSGGKPQLAFIETSAQRLSWTPRTTRGVTPAELRAEVWNAVIHGAHGVVYFPQQIGEGFKYDATPTRVAVEMALQNRRLAELADVLVGEHNPAMNGVKPQADAPIEVAWRVIEGNLYVIALNFSDDAARGRVIRVGDSAAATVQSLWDRRTIQVRRGAITDDFEPYEAKVFRFDHAGG